MRASVPQNRKLFLHESLTRFMSHELCLEMLDLTLYPAADPMLDQIDLGGTDAERLRHLQNRLFLDHVQVEHLVMPGVALPFRPTLSEIPKDEPVIGGTGGQSSAVRRECDMIYPALVQFGKR